MSGGHTKVIQRRRNTNTLVCPGCARICKGKDDAEAKERWLRHFGNCSGRARLVNKAMLVEAAPS